MNRDKLHAAVEEAHRFIDRANTWEARTRADADDVRRRKDAGEEHVYHSDFPKESGAIRRASMDLTRALADLRKPG